MTVILLYCGSISATSVHVVSGFQLMTSECCVMQELSKMAARTAVGATIRAVSKPRKFAARKAAITLVSLSLSLEWIE